MTAMTVLLMTEIIPCPTIRANELNSSITEDLDGANDIDDSNINMNHRLMQIHEEKHQRYTFFFFIRTSFFG